MRCQIPCILVLFPALVHAATEQGDVRRGARAFAQCAACHSTAPGEHLTGPSLARVWNTEAGRVDGFGRYSDALKRSGVTWDHATLDRWLADPQSVVPGTRMTFAGIRDERSRRDLIAYLAAVSEGRAPEPPPEPGAMGGMMGAGGRKPDLRAAPPEGRVRSITYCGDTYTVETADGRREKVWEFNLRFKTDSSRLGPPPGEPAVVGAGMRGDRASVVFSSPAEISRFIKRACN